MPNRFSDASLSGKQRLQKPSHTVTTGMLSLTKGEHLMFKMSIWHLRAAVCWLMLLALCVTGTTGTPRTHAQGPSRPITEFPLTRLAPQGITVGPDNAIWFTELLGNKIGRLDPRSGSITEFPLRNPLSG